ncbi:hypothetical protein [Bradyrhizobium sp. S69]|nr:hypothetical protein [Bradyrhizobium sp. S69]
MKAAAKIASLEKSKSRKIEAMMDKKTGPHITGLFDVERQPSD